MKLMPLLTAVIVTVVLYLLVFEREAVLAFAQSGPQADTQTASADGQTAAAAAATDDAREDAPQDASEVDAPAAIGVVALRSEARDVDNAVILRGRTEAVRDVTVSAETSGVVVSDPLRKGTFVEAGDVLCVLDPGTREASLDEARARLEEAEGRVPEAEAALGEARARLREAEVNLNAARSLSEGGFGSETRLVGAEAAAEAAEAGVQRANTGVISARAGIGAAAAAVAGAEKEIERLTIRAPFAGLMETDAAELGTLMQPGAACATVIQLDPIKLVGFVPELDVNKIETGAMAGARLTSGEQVQGAVTFLSRAADETTRTFRVEIDVPNPDLMIRDGQTAEILVAADGVSAHLLPQSSLTLDDEGQLGVRIVDAENTARFNPVTLLRDTPEGVLVTGLPDAADVIVTGQEYVIDGVRVTPTYREANG